MSVIKFLKIKFENDKIFKKSDYSQMKSQVFHSVSVEKIERDNVFQVKNHLIKSDTISAILNHGQGKIIALNFANANIAGGGYILGGNAQEEALCRASLLHNTIKKCKKFYWKNRLHFLPTYTHTMIYSQNVPIIRDNDGNLLKEPKLCDFITCPAVMRYFAMFMFSNKKINQIMQERISRIIQLAAINQPETLILGAFGCGAFGNKREIVYPMFEQAINQYIDDKVKIIFADTK
ncbi:MAG: TIGR02452 family protein [Neisseriaceae bacterium]|nr:TIGR02452 family protein [Neisseriaceae bacterium]MBQ9724636.1 TIGR02452 family protein [Neisseriaceae bacterium]